MFTRDGEETLRPYVENLPVADFVELRTASATLAELRNAQGDAGSSIGDLGIPFNSSTDVERNRVEIWVTDPVSLQDALREANLELPDYVEAFRVDALATPA